METSITLTRYLHTGSFERNYSNVHSEINLKSVLGTHSKLVSIVPLLIEIEPSMVLRIIKRAIESGLLRRMDETLLVLAYCLREQRNQILSREIYEVLDIFLSTPSLLMQFLSYFSKLLNKKMVLNHGMKRVLAKWYFSKSALELVDLLIVHKQLYGMSHKTIFKNFRVKIKDPEKNAIIKTLFQSNKETIESPETTEAFTKLCVHKLLKQCTSPEEVVKILNRKEYIYRMEHIPSFAVKSSEVMEFIIPNLTIKTILNNMINFHSYNFLKVSENVSRLICVQLGKTQLVTEEKLNPIRVFFIMRALEEVSRLVYYTCAEKEDSDKEEEEVIDFTPPCDKATFSNPYVLKKLYSIFVQTMKEQPKTGVRYFITLDFRRFSHRHSFLCNNKLVFCAEAQVIIALILLKKEKDVTVMTFTEDGTRLKPVPFTAETTFERAMDIYEEGMKKTPKTIQNTSLPIDVALDSQKDVDVFITMVDSIARTHGKRTKNPAVTLQTYRDHMDLKLTKYVIINMARKTQDLPKVHEEGLRGVLEINGMGPDTLNIIEAYSNNCFI